MSALAVSEIECPYCTSQVTLTTHDDGRLEVDHHEPFGSACEPGLRRLTADTAKEHGLRLMLRN